MMHRRLWLAALLVLACSLPLSTPASSVLAHERYSLDVVPHVDRDLP